MTHRTTVLGTAALAAALLATGPAPAQQGGHDWGEKNTPQFEPAWPTQTRAPITRSEPDPQMRTLAEGLVHPWAVEQMPQGGFLVTERPGRLRHVSADGALSEPIAGVPEVENRPPDNSWATQAGLLDVKLGPDFAEDRRVYMSYAKPLADDMSATAVARGRLSEDMTELTQVEEIWVQAPPSPTRMHYGSRIVFDGQGHVFITTGEHSSHEEREFAQHPDKLYGKVVRLNLDGSIPDTNPFVGDDSTDDAIWSMGHRNIQGAAMQGGQLYVIEHGPAGGDEVNLALPAQNYGWPIVAYGRRYDGPLIGSGQPRLAHYREPIYYWDPVIAPGDGAFYEGAAFPDWQGDLLIGGLVASGVVRLETEGPLVTQEERLLTELGRVRDVEVLADGTIVVATDVEEGRLVHVTPATPTQ